MIMNACQASERKKKENEDRQREVCLIGRQHLIHAGNWEWNLVTKKYTWCEEMYRIFNLPLQQSPLRTGTFFNSIHPEDRQRVVRALGKALVGERPYNIEHRIVWPDGSVRFIHGEAEVTFDYGGRPIRILGMVQDITSTHHFEKALGE
jgi:PAS domain-containing protein